MKVLFAMLILSISALADIDPYYQTRTYLTTEAFACQSEAMRITTDNVVSQKSKQQLLSANDFKLERTDAAMERARSLFLELYEQALKGQGRMHPINFKDVEISRRTYASLGNQQGHVVEIQTDGDPSMRFYLSAEGRMLIAEYMDEEVETYFVCEGYYGLTHFKTPLERDVYAFDSIKD